MKQLSSLVLLLLSCYWGRAQETEFAFYPSGLMYSEATMGHLQHIVDSLNLQFRQCDLDRTYYAKAQARAHYIRLEHTAVKAAKKDLEDNISFADFVRKYPAAVLEEDLLVIRTPYTDEGGAEELEFSSIPLNGKYEHELTVSGDLEKRRSGWQQQWAFDYRAESKYAKESLRAFYFTSEFASPALPENYARLIQYTDCMVDTTTQIIKEDAEYGYVELPQNYQKQSLKKKRQLLDQLRSTRVIGQCSMDDSPRLHARNIAILSAETASWETFLRAHLNIMNDRFERVSDGSYAWAGRQTYIRELEVLNINVSDLLLGISLRVENPSNNHYYGSISRIGRALVETLHAAEIENAMLDMIRDSGLDDYNRILVYYLFLNYARYHQDEAQQQEKIALLRTAVVELPAYLSNKINLD